MFRTLGWFCLALLWTAQAGAQSDLGVVLMYGKQATWSNTAGLRDMGSTLEKAGAKVALPEMPWGRGGWENIHVTIRQVHAMIDQEVAKLRARGARRIVVGGHSLGANVALSYAVERGNVAGVMLAAPGHRPEGWYQSDKAIHDAVDKVKALYEAGRGKEWFVGPDSNQADRMKLSTTVEVYGSWMSPRGLAAMAYMAPRLPASIPIFVAVSRDEMGFASVEKTIYTPAAKNSYSLYVVTSGPHSRVDFAVSKRATDWMLGLPKE
jgi:pimeloyl-ACP methyl ester carboxylesterase